MDRVARHLKRERRKIGNEELESRLVAHKHWLETGEKEGARFISGCEEDLREVHLVDADLKKADLSEADLSGALLERINLHGAILKGTDLSGAWLLNADLTDAFLVYANLERTNLFGANLSRAAIKARLVFANLAKTNLSNAGLAMADLSGASLQEANLSGASLGGANLTGTDLRGAELADASVHGTNLKRVVGLYGWDRARNMGSVKNAQWALYAHPRDFASWSLLRFIGTLHLFSASYISFLAIVIYSTTMRWINAHVGSIHAWAAEHAAGPVQELAALAARTPTLPVQRHLGLLLLAIGLLAIATTLHAIFCPEAIKEATETCWTRELDQPLLEYRSAMYAHFWVRYATLICFALGGGYTLLYILWRAERALWYLLAS